MSRYATALPLLALLFALAVFSSPPTARAEQPYDIDWVLQGATSSNDFGYGAAIGSDGNIYVTGATDGEMDGNVIVGERDAFLAKFSPDGTRLWTSQFGSTKWDAGLNVKLDSTGNIFVVGTRYLFSLNNGNPSYCDIEMFLTKFDPDGGEVWTYNTDASEGFYYYNLALDANDNIYVCYARYDLSAQHYICVSKFGQDGTLVWNASMECNTFDSPYALALDDSGCIYVAGKTYADLNGETNHGSADAFLVKLDQDGNIIWTKLYGYTAAEEYTCIARDHVGNLYLGGNSNGYMFLRKCDPDGNYLWHRSLSSLGNYYYSNGVALDGIGGVYITGQYNGASGFDIALVKYTYGAGIMLWNKVIGTSGSDDSLDIICDSDGSVFLPGSTNGSFDGLTNSGGYDYFLAKLLAPPASSEIISPSAGSRIAYRDSLKIYGFSMDRTGSGMSVVDVSTDGGATWLPGYDISSAGDWTTWGFDWSPPGLGTYSIMSRASSNSGYVEEEPSSMSVTLEQGFSITVDIDPPESGTVTLLPYAKDNLYLQDEFVDAIMDAAPGYIHTGWVTIPPDVGYFDIFDPHYYFTYPLSQDVTLIPDMVHYEPFVSDITNPADGEIVVSGSDITITGSASAGSPRALFFVEVSTDGGQNWALTTGTGPGGSWSTWSYGPVQLSAGVHSIQTRNFLYGISDSPCEIFDFLIYETPGPGVTVTVVNEYQLTADVNPPGSGTLSFSPVHENNIYLDGETVWVTATPNAGYALDFWSGDAAGSDNPVLVTMDSDKTITANMSFQPPTGQWVSAPGMTGWIQDVVVSPDFIHDQTVFATQDGSVYRSLDGGESWFHDASWPGGTELEISPDFANDSLIYAQGFGTVFISSSGGDSWYEHTSLEFAEMSPDISTDRTAYAWGSCGCMRLYKSTAGGGGFSDNRIITIEADALGIAPGYSGNRIFLSSGTTLYGSTSSGAIVSQVGIFAPDEFWFSPDFYNDQVMFGHKLGTIGKSSNGGANWTGLTSGNDMVLSPNYDTDHTLYVGDDSGVKKSTDGGATWNYIGAGEIPGPVTSLAVTPDGNILYAGTVQYGLYIYVISNVPVSAITNPADGALLSCDVMTVEGSAIDNLGAPIQTVEVSTDGGANWNAATDTSGDGSWLTWSYDWTLPVSGDYTIMSRATSSDEAETPGQGVSVSVGDNDPYSAITTPADGGVIASGLGTYNIWGTAGDGYGCGNGVTMVEVSTDGGETWAAAADMLGDGTFSKWIYTWNSPPDGCWNILCRATDVGGNVETPGAGRTVSVGGLQMDSLTPVVTGGGPAQIGKTIIWQSIGSGGCGANEYRYQILPEGGSWSIARGWSSDPDWAWSPSTAGKYQVVGQVRKAGGTTPEDSINSGWYEVYDPEAPAGLSDLKPNPVTPQEVNTTITWTATPSGGSGEYQLRFWVWDGTWSVAQNWSSATTYPWTPTHMGKYQIRCDVRNVGATSVQASLTYPWMYVITDPVVPPCTLGSLVPTPGSPVNVNDLVQWEAFVADGSGSYEFRFWVYNGSSWSVGQPWSGSATFDWTPTISGTYRIVVQARNEGASLNIEDAINSGPFMVQ